jgi:hypothetical protein
MPEYRAFLVGPDGHFHSSQVLDAPDDDQAIEAAKPLVDGHDVEVWHRDRKVTVLTHKSEEPAKPFNPPNV